jgi:hypothetical protein
MAEESFTRWLELPQGVPVRFGDLPRLIARVLHEGEWAQVGAEIGIETELEVQVDSGALTVRDPLTLGPQTFPVGRTLRASVLLPEDLRPLVAARGIGLRLIADGAAAESAPVIETPKQRRWRLLEMHDAEVAAGGESGALARVTKTEKRTRPTADRSNIGKSISKARKERDEERKGGALTRLLK